MSTEERDGKITVAIVSERTPVGKLVEALEASGVNSAVIVNDQREPLGMFRYTSLSQQAAQDCDCPSCTAGRGTLQ